jgi:uncharacterized protein YidB (DUF937 family)
MGVFDSILGGVMSPGLGRGGMLGRGRGGGMSPLTLALLGTLAYRTFKGKGRLADMLARSAPVQETQTQSPSAEDRLGASTGDFLSPDAISGGLANLFNRFRQNGQADKMESWVAAGPNAPMAPTELEKGLGEERISWLMEQTGMPRDELLAGLSRSLPEVVDSLTPEGHLPSPEEAQRLLK